jgi:hypothetical protein
MSNQAQPTYGIATYISRHDIMTECDKSVSGLLVRITKEKFI